jgi:hypothetical protein
VWRDSLTATIHVAPPLLPSDPDVKASGTTDLRGSFCISITPPGGRPLKAMWGVLGKSRGQDTHTRAMVECAVL